MIRTSFLFGLSVVIVEPNLRDRKIQDLRDLPPSPATQTQKSGRSTFTPKPRKNVKFKFSHTRTEQTSTTFSYTAASSQSHPTSHHPPPRYWAGAEPIAQAFTP